MLGSARVTIHFLLLKNIVIICNYTSMEKVLATKIGVIQDLLYTFYYKLN